ncbi:hypothetical protein ACIG47_13305 [Promicromonospora sp. NPDC052451]|uniref:hypothetical protein n=1 Tax=Promicromonospora sp. NPDC052451 TaxID=3364407 RepID=UPI0037CC44A4
MASVPATVGTVGAEVMYPAYRDYIETRTTVNSAMMALVAGSQIASHSLQLVQGSTRPLAELFPAVPHIGRFNLRSDQARDVLNSAEHHLASVALPYALSTHEDFVMASIETLKAEGVSLVHSGAPLKKPIKAWNMHPVLFESADHTPAPHLLEVFNLVREMRNCTAHNGGRADEKLLNYIDSASQPALELWTKLARQRPTDSVVNGRVVLTAEHVITAFAITKRLGREINRALAGGLSTSMWATTATEDFALSTTKVKNSSAWRRALVGYTRRYYQALGLAEADLESAARATGHWTRQSWTD